MATALCREIALSSKPRDRVESVYFGGGTPSYLPEDMTGEILQSVRQYFDVSDDAEITLEANPNNLTPGKLEFYRSVGINRLSIGIQSFSDDELDFLTRTHSSAQAVASVENAKAAGFENFTIDLIFGLPGQSRLGWQLNVQKAVDLGCPHLAIYNLTVEEGTHLYKLAQTNRLPPRDDQLELDMYLSTIEKLAAAGYEQYELSNYAKPGFRSIHNSRYWTREPYLGLGPSAHSFDGTTRWWNVRDLVRYIQLLETGTKPIAETEVLSPEQICIELILLGLRQREGLDIASLERVGGWSFDQKFADVLEKTSASWTRQNNRLRLTDHGMLLYNRICSEFVSAL